MEKAYLIPLAVPRCTCGAEATVEVMDVNGGVVGRRCQRCGDALVEVLNRHIPNDELKETPSG